MHALKLTLKCVTILSPLDFKRPKVQVFSERQLISFNKKNKKKLYSPDISDPVKAKTLST